MGRDPVPTGPLRKPTRTESLPLSLCDPHRSQRVGNTPAPWLREPGGTLCLHFDGGLTALQLKTCNATEPKQHWAYDAATLVFRHAADSRRCIDFFVAHGAFGVWKCRDGIEINSQQQFRYDEQRDRFCLLSDPEQCLQEATSALLY